jgi:hypothetical protein
MNQAFAAAFGTTSAGITGLVSKSVMTDNTAFTTSDGSLTSLITGATVPKLGAVTIGTTSAAGFIVPKTLSYWSSKVQCGANRAALFVEPNAQMTTVSFVIPNSGQTCAIVFEASNSSSAVLTTQVTMQNITLAPSSTLIVSGLGIVQFPPQVVNASYVMVTGTSGLNCAGGAQLTGYIGNTTITVGGVNLAAPLCTVKPLGTFIADGRILGDSSATLQVYGPMGYTGSSVGPLTIDLRGVGAVIASDPNTSPNGFLHIIGSVFKHSGTLSMTGSSVLRLNNPSPAINFGTIETCDLTSVIEVRVWRVDKVDHSSNGVAMLFDAASTNTSNMWCDVRLYDYDGRSRMLLNTNKPYYGGGSVTFQPNGQLYWTAAASAMRAPTFLIAGAAAMTWIVAHLL